MNDNLPRYERTVPLCQFGANTIHAIYAHIDDVAAHLGVDVMVGREIVGRVLDILENGAERVGGWCDRCQRHVPPTESRAAVLAPVLVCSGCGQYPERLLVAMPPTTALVIPPIGD